MVCESCDRKCRRHGKNRNGTQRFRCPVCKVTYSEEWESQFADMRVPEDKALIALHMLCEGHADILAGLSGRTFSLGSHTPLPSIDSP